ncbi:MAG: hypothetical protein AAF125_05125, partial [Chloroflexota bacterium]
GGAALLSGLFARPVSGAMVLVGLMLLVGAGTALAVIAGALPTTVLAIAGTRAAWIPVAVVTGLVMLLPLFRRLRG